MSGTTSSQQQPRSPQPSGSTLQPWPGGGSHSQMNPSSRTSTPDVQDLSVFTVELGLLGDESVAPPPTAELPVGQDGGRDREVQHQGTAGLSPGDGTTAGEGAHTA